MILDTSNAVRRWVLATNTAAADELEDGRPAPRSNVNASPPGALDHDLHGPAVTTGAKAIARLAHRGRGLRNDQPHATPPVRSAGSTVTRPRVDEMTDYAVC